MVRRVQDESDAAVMRVPLFIPVLFACFTGWLAFAETGSGSDNKWTFTSNTPIGNMNISCGDDGVATLDFREQKVTYTNGCTPKKSAKVFYQEVLRMHGNTTGCEK